MFETMNLLDRIYSWAKKKEKEKRWRAKVKMAKNWTNLKCKNGPMTRF